MEFKKTSWYFRYPIVTGSKQSYYSSTTAVKNMYLVQGFTKTKLIHVCALKKTKLAEASHWRFTW